MENDNGSFINSNNIAKIDLGPDSRVQKLLEEYNLDINSKIDLDINGKVQDLLEEYNLDEKEEIEYNNYILSEIIDFIDEVCNNKDMLSVDLYFSDFKQTYYHIVEFLIENRELIKKELQIDENILFINNLFMHYSKGNFNSLKSYEDFINYNLSNILNKNLKIEFTNFFYTDLKYSITKFIMKLNDDILKS